MTKHCSTIVPHTNFPSEFSINGKRHNISLKENKIFFLFSQIENQRFSTSFNNNILNEIEAPPSKRGYQNERL